MEYLGVKFDLKNVPALDSGFIPFGVWMKAYLRDAKMPIAMKFSNGVVAGEKVKSLKPKTKTVEEVFEPTIAVRTSKADMKYNESTFNFGKYSVIFRLYDDAVAYRFVTRFGKKEINVIDETVAYNFVNDDKILFPEE